MHLYIGSIKKVAAYTGQAKAGITYD
jgi:hypothetical protein